jgi:hypothetical protein
MTQSSIEFQMRCSASEALQRIIDGTAREGLLYLEPTRPRYREFLSRVSGNRFRIWKWSARGRGRRNQLVPMLRGEVRDTEGGSELRARFVLHPFAKIWPPLAPIIFLGIAATVWFQSSDLKGKLFAGFSLLFACFLGFSALSGRGRKQEEAQITQFVEKLFRDVRR